MIAPRYFTFVRAAQMCLSSQLRLKIDKKSKGTNKFPTALKNLTQSESGTTSRLKSNLESFPIIKIAKQNNQVASFHLQRTYYQKEGGKEVFDLLVIKPKQDLDFPLKAEFFQSIGLRLSLKELAPSEIVTFRCHLKEDYSITWINENVMDVLGNYVQDFIQNYRLWSQQIYLDNQRFTLDKLWNILQPKNCTYKYSWQIKNCTYEYHFLGREQGKKFSPLMRNKFQPLTHQLKQALKALKKNVKKPPLIGDVFNGSEKSILISAKSKISSRTLTNKTRQNEKTRLRLSITKRLSQLLEGTVTLVS